MFSLKVRVTILPLKPVELGSGTDLTRTGGSLSFGPPEGVPGLAHPIMMSKKSSAKSAECEYLKFKTNDLL